MMLIGGMEDELGKSPETGRPGGGTVPSPDNAAPGIPVEPVATGDGAFHAAARRSTMPSYMFSDMFEEIWAELVSD